MSTKQESKTTVSHLPEHGPIDENGREILLQVKNVDITFGKGDDAVKAVKNASFDIYKGETFSLVGESGSGKTTIGRAVIRVNPCSAGEILYKGVKISGKIPHSHRYDRTDLRLLRNLNDSDGSKLQYRTGCNPEYEGPLGRNQKSGAGWINYACIPDLLYDSIKVNRQDRLTKVIVFSEREGRWP